MQLFSSVGTENQKKDPPEDIHNIIMSINSNTECVYRVCDSLTSLLSITIIIHVVLQYQQ